MHSYRQTAALRAALALALAAVAACGGGGDKSPTKPAATPSFALTGRDTVSVGDTLRLSAIADFQALTSETLGAAVFTIGWSDANAVTLRFLTPTTGSTMRYSAGDLALKLAVSAPNNSSAVYTAARAGWIIGPSASGKNLTFTLTPTALYAAHTFDSVLEKATIGNKVVHVR